MGRLALLPAGLQLGAPAGGLEPSGEVADMAGSGTGGGEGAGALPGQLPRLTPEELRRAQLETLEMPRRRYGLAARVLFVLLDVLYGKARTLSKFTVLELGQHPVRIGVSPTTTDTSPRLRTCSVRSAMTSGYTNKKARPRCGSPVSAEFR